MLRKYTSNKNAEFKVLILFCYKNKEIYYRFIDPLDNVIGHFRGLLIDYESGHNLSSEIDNIIQAKRINDNITIFINDIEKIHRLLIKRDIEINYLEILSFFVENIEQNLSNKLAMTQQAAEWLKGRSKDVREKLSKSELEFEAMKLKKELTELNEKYLPKHPKIIRTQERIRVIEEQFGGGISKDFASGEISTQYNQLQREVDSQGKIYEAMLSRLKETSASEGIEDTNVVVIDRAEVPTRPVAPRFFLNVFLSILVGAFGAAALCIIFESLDNTVKTPEDIEKLGELPLLGVVSHWEAAQKQLVVHEDRSSGVAEGFRAIRTSLLFSSPDHPLRTLVITSPFAEEGKTIVACNLAATIAQSGARVLLVDADMRRPRVNQVFQQNGVHGLSHALTDSANPSGFIQKTKIENLSVLFCGPLPPTPSEMIGSQKMHQLIEKLKGQFDYVLFDSPPFLVVTDPVVLSTFVDGVIIVTRYNKTPKDVIARGKQKFLGVQAKLVGVILNDVDLEQERYRYPAYSYYHDPLSEKGKADIPSLVAKVASDQDSAISSHPPRNFSPK